MAQEKQDPIDVTLTKCLDQKENQTTAGMCHCTYTALEEWDKKLNATYKSLLPKLNASAKTSLVTAQRQWVLFKEKEINLIDATYGKADGTMWQVVRATKVLSLTKDRAVELESLLETLPEL
nr:lysozyme inhibitor LprI family protein [Rufibacter sediminis]